MIKTIVLGVLTVAMAFFVGASYINAQEATDTPSPTPTVTQDDSEDDVPDAAPKTGFGY